MLGLGMPVASDVVRIAAFQAALEGMDGPTRFWSRSLQVDGWATARTLLGWRDQLVDAGWRGASGWYGARLVDLAAADEAATALPPGVADRVAAVIADLRVRPAPPIRSVRLVDARPLHAAGWRRLFDTLEERAWRSRS